MKFDEMEFEDRLKAAMRRERAPVGFAEKVLSQTVAKRPVRWRGAAVVAIAAMVALAVLIPVSERRQVERAETAKEQTLRALAITNAQLRMVREKIQRDRGRRR